MSIGKTYNYSFTCFIMMFDYKAHLAEVKKWCANLFTPRLHAQQGSCLVTSQREIRGRSRGVSRDVPLPIAYFFAVLPVLYD